MTNRELQEELKKFPDDAEVFQDLFLPSISELKLVILELPRDEQNPVVILK